MSCVSALLFCLFVAVPCAEERGPSEAIRALILQAGNAEDEVERYRLLAQLQGQPDLDAGLRKDVDGLLPLVDRWANGREKYWDPTEKRRAAENGYLCDFLIAMGRNRFPVPEIAEASPLYPILCMYLGRALIQGPIQSGSLARDPAKREQYFGRGRALLQIARDAFPENRVIGMYLDEPIPWPPIHPPDPGAPEWANCQREALEKLTDIIIFWIDERQAPDGQFGGGWGDDVEMWRHWTPALIGFDDPKVNAAQRKISDGLFALKRMAGGYTSRMSDVEHTGEDSGDTGTAMMHVDPDNPDWKSRAVRLAELMRDLWTGRNERGFLQFKSTYFTSETVHPDSQRACDTVYHPRAVQPALLCWQRTGDPELTALFSGWMDTWVDAAARAERGKPAGILPSAIHWPDGTVGGLGDDWWDPRNHREASLYRWPSAIGQMTSSLLLTYHMTGDRKYLAPISSMATIRAEYLDNPQTDAAPGSAAWCAQRMGFLSDALGKYRLLTGDGRFDDLLLKDAGGYVKYRLTGDRHYVLQTLKKTAEAFRFDREAYTSEVRWTDRTFSFYGNYANYYAHPRRSRPSTGTLYSSVTGDFGNPLYFPMNAVRWRTPAQDIAVLVTDHSTSHLSAEVYHFGDDPRPMGAELYLLERGDYEVTLTADGGNVSRSRLTVERLRTQITFTLPSRRLCTLEVRPAGP